jgi:hypothetical protein
MAILSQEQQDEIRDELDAQITAAINPLIAKMEGMHPDALISVPRQVVVGQKTPAKSRIVHTGNTRPVTKAEQEAVASNGRARK